MEFNEKLKQYRKDANLTQQQLANKLGMSRSTIAEIERGTIKGTLAFVTKLSEISNTSLNYWISDVSEVNYEIYNAVDILINTMIETGHIDEEGRFKSQEDKELVIGVLEKEIKIKLQKQKGK